MHLGKLDLNLLVVFEALWRLPNVSRTAAELTVAQSTVSSSLARLREVFDDPLFTWDGEAMQPSTKAYALAESVGLIVERSKSLLHSEGFGGMVRRHETIASIDYVFAVLGEPLCRELDLTSPGATIGFVDINRHILATLRSQTIATFVMPQGAPGTLGLRYKPLFSDHYVLVRSRLEPSDVRSASRPNALTLQEFLAFPKVLFSLDALTVQSHEMTALMASGADITVKMLTPSYLSISSILQNSNMISVIPSNILKIAKTSDILEIVPCEIDFPTLNIGLYWDPAFDKDPFHQWMRGVLTKVLQSSFQND